MSAVEEVWSRKNDDALRSAAEELSSYTEDGERVIRGELRKRGIPEPPPVERTSGATVGAVKRYAPAYRLARSMGLFATILQVGGVVLGLLLAMGTGSPEGRPLGVASGLAVAVMCYLAGAFMRMQVETLRASLDTAVSLSPLLSDTQKATMILTKPRDWGV